MNTENPPKQNLDQAKQTLQYFAIALICLAVLVLIALVTKHVVSAVFYFLCIPVTGIAYFFFQRTYYLRTPVVLIACHYEVKPQLKNGDKITVQVAFLVPEKFTITTETTDRLRITTVHTLSEYCIQLEELPTFKQVESQVVSAVDEELKDLNIPVMRCNVLKIESPERTPQIQGIIIGNL